MTTLVHTLKELFEAYKFKGQIYYPVGVGFSPSKFVLDIFRFDPKTGLFIAGGEDDVGLSAIVGKVEPKDSASCDVEFKQILWYAEECYSRTGKLVKENGHVVMTGYYPCGCSTYTWRFEIAPKQNIIRGWNGVAASVDLSRMA